MERVYVNDEHSNTLMKSMAKLWKERKYCDAVIDVNSEYIELHKLVLLAASPSIIHQVNSITDTGTIVIKLEGKCYSKKAAKLCVQYLYKGIAKLTDTNVKAVTKIAEALELKEILEICSSFQDTFKSSDADKELDTEEEENKRGNVENISKSLTEEALDNMKQTEENSHNRGEVAGVVHSQIPLQSTMGDVSQGYQFGNQHRPEVESAMKSIEGTVDTVHKKGVFKGKRKLGLHLSTYVKKTTYNKRKTLERSLVQKQENLHKMRLSQSITPVESQTQIIKQEPVEEVSDTKQDRDRMHCTPEQGHCSVQDDIQGHLSVRENEQDHSYVQDGVQDISCVQDGLQDHSSVQNGVQITPSNNVSSELDETRTRFFCDLCEGTYSTNMRLKIHKRRIHDRQIQLVQCSYCEAVFKNKCNKRRHEQILHFKQRKFTCEVCGAMFAAKESLKGHLIGQHGIGEKFKCAKCQKEFAFMQNLRAHEKIYHREIPAIFQCDQCSKTYNTAKSLNTHVKFFHGKRESVCEHCGEKYSYPSSLARHKKKHHKKMKTEVTVKKEILD